LPLSNLNNNLYFLEMEAYRKYFTEEQLQKLGESQLNWGVNVLTIGHNIHPPTLIYPDAKHPQPYLFNWEAGRILSEYQIVYVSSGKGVLELQDAEPIMIEAGTIFLLFPNVWHRYRPLLETGWEEFWVGFSGHYAEYLMRQDCFNPKNPVLKVGLDNEILHIFIRLIDISKQESRVFSQMASCFVIQLLGLVNAAALMMDKTKSRQEQIIQAIRFKIHENWNENLDFEQIAAENNVTYDFFRKAFKGVMGVPPGQYLLNIKIEKAAQMLRETDLTISEIATKTGFENEFYFSRMFKNKMNCTASSYRKKEVV
jgi:AraC-like DNA-binding protein